MGRKQNPLIVDYFRRGKKLEDNSNRYEQQCIKCGELFSKGRIDGMLTHLLKRCPQLTQQEREAAYYHVKRPSKAALKRAAAESTAHGQAGEIVFDSHGWDAGMDSQQFDFDTSANDVSLHNPHTTSGLIGEGYSEPTMHTQMYSEQSALDTLAEASRRHLDYTQQRQAQAYGTHETAMAQESDRQIVEQLLINAINQTPVEHDGDGHTSYSDAAASFSARQSTLDHRSHQAQAGTQPLVQAATAATQRMDQRDARYLSSTTLDPLLEAMTVSLGGTQEPLEQAQVTSTSSRGQSDSTQPQGEPLHPQAVPGLGPAPKGGRARFNEDRRKQVQETRRLGACLRCRMLKKPCGSGTPCAKCAHVDSARLWKWPCVRTKLADELTLYSMAYLSLRAQSDFAAELPKMTASLQPSEVEINFDRSCVVPSAFLPAVTHSPVQTISSTGAEQGDAWTLLDESDDVLERISQHLVHESRVQQWIESEPNDFLRKTLLEARRLYYEQSALLKAQQLEQSPEPGTKSRRNHIAPGLLLQQVIELWLLTKVIVTSTPSNTNMSVRIDAIEIDHQHPNFRLIHGQVLAKVEIRCQQLCKSVLNELERHMLQRQQVSGLATSLSAVILLSCVERMTAMYHILAAKHPGGPSFWDSESPSFATLHTQGPRFAALLTMLLRVRGLPPATVRTTDDTLAACWPHMVGNKGNAAQEAEMLDYRRRWLDLCKVNVSGLIKLRDTPGRAEDGWRGWDMKFVAAVLLPAGL